MFKFSQRQGAYKYSTGSAQTSSELLKFTMSMFLFCREASRAAQSPGVDSQRWPRDAWDAARRQLAGPLVRRLVGLALLYAVNNQLAFLLYRIADMATNNLFKSGGSFVSAVMLFFALGRPITPRQWICIVLQVCGLVIVQYDDCARASILPPRVYLILLTSLLITSLCNVWNEHLLKQHSGTSLHLQNLVLYVVGAVLNFCFFVASDWSAGASVGRTFFQGYNLQAVLLIFCTACLGLVVSAVLKYADTVVRTSAAACVTGFLYIFGVLALGSKFRLSSFLGCVSVFLSTYLYLVSGVVDKPAPSTQQAPPTATQQCDHESVSRLEVSPTPRWWNRLPSVGRALGLLLFFVLIPLAVLSLSTSPWTRSTATTLLQATNSETPISQYSLRRDWVGKSDQLLPGRDAVLVYLFGHTRAAMSTFPNMVTNVLRPLNASLACTFWMEGSASFENVTDFVSGSLRSATLAPAIFIDAVQLAMLQSRPNRRCAHVDGFEYPLVLNHMRAKVLNTIVLERFDWFVFIRTDVVWETPHPKVNGEKPFIGTVEGIGGGHITVHKSLLAQVLSLGDVNCAGNGSDTDAMTLSQLLDAMKAPRTMMKGDARFYDDGSSSSTSS